ncbi:MAG: hypothetical protein ACI9NY_000683 [Kiritimatiellia bacterium]|jgi:hypothetical protein
MNNVLTNKHLIIALIVAPMLAIIAYYAVDYNVSEKPHQAVKGESYPLIAKSNCRYESGKCTFENGDIEINLVTEKISDNQIELQLRANRPINGAKIALVNEDNFPLPQTMTPLDNSNTHWQITLANSISDSSRLQIALAVNQSLYYGETVTTFTSYKTGFSQKNIH